MKPTTLTRSFSCLALASAALLTGCDGAQTSTAGTAVGAPQISFTITPSRISPSTGAADDEFTSFRWLASNATSCEAFGDWTGPRPTSFQPTATSNPYRTSKSEAGIYSYTLTCTGAGGTTSTTQTLTVRESPLVEIEIVPREIRSGERATVRYSTQGAVFCTTGVLPTAAFGWGDGDGDGSAAIGATNTVIGANNQALSGGEILLDPVTNVGANFFALACLDADGNFNDASAVLQVNGNGTEPRFNLKVVREVPAPATPPGNIPFLDPDPGNLNRANTSVSVFAGENVRVFWSVDAANQNTTTCTASGADLVGWTRRPDGAAAPQQASSSPSGGLLVGPLQQLSSGTPLTKQLVLRCTGSTGTTTQLATINIIPTDCDGAGDSNLMSLRDAAARGTSSIPPPPASANTLCLAPLCGVEDAPNVINTSQTDFATIRTALAPGPDQLATRLSITVVDGGRSSSPPSPPATRPLYAAGSRVGFVLSRPDQVPLTLELLQDVTVSTGTSSESLSEQPLDIFGFTNDASKAFVFVTPTTPFSTVQVAAEVSGASLNSELRVHAACVTIPDNDPRAP